MTPRIWHAQVPRIAKHNRRLAAIAGVFLLSAVIVMVIGAAREAGARSVLLAVPLLAATFAVACLGVIEVWFREPPPSLRDRPLKAVHLWIGAFFFDIYLGGVVAMFMVAVLALATGK